jgi:hypothetical protein
LERYPQVDASLSGPVSELQMLERDFPRPVKVLRVDEVFDEVE